DDWNAVLARQKAIIAAEEILDEALPLKPVRDTLHDEPGDTEAFARFDLASLDEGEDEAEVEYEEPRATAREMASVSVDAEGLIEREEASAPPMLELPRVEVAFDARATFEEPTAFEAPQFEAPQFEAPQFEAPQFEAPAEAPQFEAFVAPA